MVQVVDETVVNGISAI